MRNNVHVIRWIFRGCACGFAIIQMAAAPVAEADEYRYAIMQVPGLIGGDYEIYRAVNDLGHIVGAADTPEGSYHPVFWNGKVLIDMGTFGGLAGEAWDINNRDEVVGQAMDSNGKDQAFFWHGGTLDMMGGGTLRWGRAYCINDRGQIAGEGGLPHEEGVGRPLLWEGGEFIVLPEFDPDHGHGEVWDINESGVMVGTSWGGSNTQATAWLKNKTMLLGSLGDGTARSHAWQINDDNIVAGQSYGIGVQDTTWYATIWVHGKIFNISKYGHDIGGRLGSAKAINNRGEIIGNFKGRKDEEFHPYIYSPEYGFEAIERLMPPYHNWDFNYFLGSVEDINNHGQIVGHAAFANEPIQTSHSYLLTPIDPELTLVIHDGPLRADAINTFTVTHVQPGATIKFFYGKKGGGKRIPGCDALAAMTQIDDPVLFAEAIADVDGNAELDIYIPPHGAAHKGFLLQAVDFENCEESQLVLKKVE